MKKIFTLFPAMLLVVISNAQLTKGTILLGGDLFVSTYKLKDGFSEYNSTGYGLSPVFAVAVKDNKFFGGSLSYGHYKNGQPPSYTSSEGDSYGASVFYRCYKPVLNKIYAFVQAGIPVNYLKNEITQSQNSYITEKNFSVGLNVSPGISVAVSKKIYLEAGLNNVASLSYQHTNTTGNNSGNNIDKSSSGFSFSSSLGSFSYNLYFGFRFFIPKKSG
jgi:hypothetical protein